MSAHYCGECGMVIEDTASAEFHDKYCGSHFQPESEGEVEQARYEALAYDAETARLIDVPPGETFIDSIERCAIGWRVMNDEGAWWECGTLDEAVRKAVGDA